MHDGIFFRSLHYGAYKCIKNKLVFLERYQVILLGKTNLDWLWIENVILTRFIKHESAKTEKIPGVTKGSRLFEVTKRDAA